MGLLNELPSRAKVATIIIRVLTLTVSSFDFPCSCADVTHISLKLDQGVKYLSDLIHAIAFTHVCTSKVGIFQTYVGVVVFPIFDLMRPLTDC